MKSEKSVLRPKKQFILQEPTLTYYSQLFSRSDQVNQEALQYLWNEWRHEQV